MSKPTVVAVASNDDRNRQDEIFGPFAALMTSTRRGRLSHRQRHPLRAGGLCLVARIMEAQHRLASGIV